MNWALRLLALGALYVALEGVVDLASPALARPVGRWLSRQRSPWFLVGLWLLSAVAMTGSWWLGMRGLHVASASALFIAAGTCAIVGTIAWRHAVNEPNLSGGKRDRS
jgi:hypothetical protein